MPRLKPGTLPAPKQSLATLFDKLMAQHAIKNDAALARTLEITAPEISKARRGYRAIGASLILRIHEIFGIPVAEIREHMVEVPA